MNIKQGINNGIKKLVYFILLHCIPEISEHSPLLYNLEGSIFKWANEKRPMVDREDQPTSFAHPYNAVFGKLLNSENRKSNS